jgi:hypothetical protein
MKMSYKEDRLLSGLIGKKVQTILVPSPRNSISPPVELAIILGNRSTLVIDSCARKQGPAETGIDYPQLRVREQKTYPHYPNGYEIKLGRSGQLVVDVKITDENIFSPSDIVHYTKSIYLRFSSGKEITITRPSFRSPSLVIADHESENAPVLCEQPEYTTQNVRAY